MDEDIEKNNVELSINNLYLASIIIENIKNRK